MVRCNVCLLKREFFDCYYCEQCNRYSCSHCWGLSDTVHTKCLSCYIRMETLKKYCVCHLCKEFLCLQMYVCENTLQYFCWSCVADPTFATAPYCTICEDKHILVSKFIPTRVVRASLGSLTLDTHHEIAEDANLP